MDGAPDDPAAVASAVASMARPVLVGLDVDGVLAPIVAHADDAVLLPRIFEVVADLASRTPLAVVSGRSLADLERFAFPAAATVVGSHGMEWRSGPAVELDGDEQERLGRLGELAEIAAGQAGSGAWVERKPAGVVLHVREADLGQAQHAIVTLLRDSTGIDGAHVKTGHGVVELLARTTSKATAIAAVRRAVGAASVVFVGDDRTDEEVFAALGDGDCTVRVGAGPTVAGYRLAGPPEVLALLDALRAAFTA